MSSIPEKSELKKENKPASGKRSQIVFYITSWPKDRVFNQISVKIGYPFKQGDKPTVKIDNNTFTLVSKADKAFINKPENEKGLIEAMKKGKKMLVIGNTRTQKTSFDTFSLTGLSKALEELNQKCPSNS